MMKDIFSNKIGVANQFILDPFTYQMQFAFRNTFNMNKDLYKYKIAISIEKVRLNFSPIVLRDQQKFKQYLEAQSYIRDLRRFRPHIRIQTFIDFRNQNGGRSCDPDIEKKRKAVIRDWFRLVLWYVRLRRAAKSCQTHFQDMKQRGVAIFDKFTTQK